MTFLWTMTATFLYVEMALCLIFTFPILSASRWRSIFKSRQIAFMVSYVNFYFFFLLFLLIIMFIESVNEIRKYSGSISEAMRNNPLAENTQHMKLFRAQRNFYIAGFSIFLFIVLRRVIGMLNNTAVMEADSQAALKQASSASQAAKQLMDKDSIKGSKEAAGALEKKEAQVKKLIKELEESRTQQKALKAQADNNNKEYDRVLSEMAFLQGKLEKLEGKSEGKKAN